MPKGKKGKSSIKRKRGKDTITFNKGDCVAVKGDTKEPNIVVINQDVKATETTIKAIPMERVDKGYFLYPKDNSKEAWVYVRDILGGVSLEATENGRCFLLAKEEEGRIQKNKNSEPQGEININKIR